MEDMEEMEENFYDRVFYKETPTNNEQTWAYYIKGQTGAFATALCQAYELADRDNRMRLAFAFPLLFITAHAWRVSDNPDNYLKQILKGK